MQAERPSLTKQIAVDWEDHGYYHDAEKPEWIALFWRPESTFKQAFDSLNLDSVLEIACGHGRHTAQFINKAGRVTLVDVNRSNIEVCRERFREVDKVDCIVNDGSSLTCVESDSFDSIFSYDAMVHFEFEDVISYIQECARVLVPGGKALLHMSDYSDNPGGLYKRNPHWRNFMSFEVASHVGQRAGLSVVSSNRFNWGGPIDGMIARDCLIMFEKSFSLACG